MKLDKRPITASKTSQNQTAKTQHVVRSINQQISFLRSLMTRMDCEHVDMNTYTTGKLFRTQGRNDRAQVTEPSPSSTVNLENSNT